MIEKVVVPYFIPDTPVARKDIAAQYTAVNRMDQGIQLILDEFQRRNLLNNSLIIFTSDNGIPFPSGRTNLYDPGMKEPLIIMNPYGTRQGVVVDDFASLLDITPTILRWFHIPYPKYKIFKSFHDVRLTGRSLLPLTNAVKQRRFRRSTVFSSHSLHEVTMYYPIRSIRTKKYKLLHNLNFGMPFPIDQDFYLSPTFQDILNRTQHQMHTNWYKTLGDYYYRQEHELYDLETDPEESKNVAKNATYAKVFTTLQVKLIKWRNETDDPWICSPHFVLENSGSYKRAPVCMPLYN